MIFFWSIRWNGMMVNPIRLPAWLSCLLVWSVVAGAVIACGKPAVIGLRPDYPPVEKKWYALLAEFVEVDSLAPTFRWQPLNVALVAPSTTTGYAHVDKVHYEIRIWRTVTKGTGKLVYARDRLTATEHRIPLPLSPGTRYFWSVRAHFEINGRRRITEWTLAGYLLRAETVPNEACLRFKTPLAEKRK